MRRLLPVAVVLLLGCQGYTTSPRQGDGGLCGRESEPCCGVSGCDDGLACVAGTCTSSSCGTAFAACCAMGVPCGPGLSCTGGACMPAGDGGAGGDCGGSGQACCASDPPCGAGLACLGGACMDAPPCGAEGMACCSGDVCETGNVCVDSVCRREVPIPMCTADGGACGASSECCSTNCSGGVCSGGPPPPPPPPSCGSAFACYDCTLEDGCIWCDGICTASSNRSACADYREEIWECLL